MLSTVDLLVKIACFVKKKSIFSELKVADFINSTRRPIVLNLPLQYGILGINIMYKGGHGILTERDGSIQLTSLFNAATFHLQNLLTLLTKTC